MLHPGLTMTHPALPAQAILANMGRKSLRIEIAAPMQASDTNLQPRHSPAIGIRLGTTRNRPLSFTGGDLTSRQLGKSPLRTVGTAPRSHPCEQSRLRSNFRVRAATNGWRPRPTNLSTTRNFGNQIVPLGTGSPASRSATPTGPQRGGPPTHDQPYSNTQRQRALARNPSWPPWHLRVRISRIQSATSANPLILQCTTNGARVFPRPRQATR